MSINNIQSILSKLEYGLEIGGPSGILEKMIPIYKVIKQLDGFNVFDNNQWQTKFDKDFRITNGSITGKQYNKDIDKEITHDKKYDYIIISHVIEHLTNPMNYPQAKDLCVSRFSDFSNENASPCFCFKSVVQSLNQTIFY